MITQCDQYPSVGYHQETYAEREEDWYPSGGMHMPPSFIGAPTSNYHMRAEAGYTKTDEGMWSGHNKHHHEFDGKSHDHHKNKHGYDAGHGGYAQQHEGWSGKNKHHNDWSGKHEQHSHGYKSSGYVSGGGCGPPMQPVGYGCPSKHHEKEECWGFKDIKD